MKHIYEEAVRAIRDGKPAAMVTVIGVSGSAPRESGSRMVVFLDGSIVGTIGGGTLEYRLIESAQEAIRTGRPIRKSVNLAHDLGMCCGGNVEAYIEPLEAQLDLIIFGGGHVGQATARIASDAGFKVTVVDPREDFSDSSLFSEGVVAQHMDPLRLLDQLPWRNTAFYLVVTHSHQLDQDLVEAILPRNFGWLGMIGSRTKVAKFFLRFRAAGMNPELFSKLCAPVGLDIGAETPAEIAISIVAELVRVRRSSNATCIPLSELPMDARGGTGIASPPFASGAALTRPPQ